MRLCFLTYVCVFYYIDKHYDSKCHIFINWLTCTFHLECIKVVLLWIKSMVFIFIFICNLKQAGQFIT